MSERPLTSEEKKLVEENIPLAKFLYGIYVQKFEKKAEFGLDSSELLSQAYHGLIRGARRYRAYGEEHGYSEESIASGKYFSAFVRKSIIGQMLDYLRKIDHVHSSIRRDYKTLQANGLGATDLEPDDLAKKSGMTRDRMDHVVSRIQAKPTSLQASVGAEDDLTVGDLVPSEGDTVEATAREAFLRRILYDSYSSLSPLAQVVIALKYIEYKKLPDIARELGITSQQVREVHTEALLLFHSSWVEHLE